MNQQQTEQLRYLFARYVNGLSTRAEYDAFLQIVNEADSDAELKYLLNQLWEELDQEQPATFTVPRKSLIRRLAAYGIAASVLLALAIGYYVTRSNNSSTAELIAPIQQGISLRLASGQTLHLTKNYKGTLSGTNARQQDSLLTYTGTTTSIPAEEKNTLTNNGHEKFSLRLSDGTEAILDIGSSLTYPVAFSKTSREVTLTGQGYFKVKHQSTRFLVHYDHNTTEDIGTEFNITAYENEPATTTLVEGRIKVNEKILQPGEAISGDKVSRADLEAATAWLQDRYIFNNEPLENIMHWVSRIYGVKVIYQDEHLKQMTFGGSFNRKKKLASVLNFFRQTGGVDFRVEGQTITVFKTTAKNK